MKTQTLLETVIVGFGKIGAAYADDPVMAKEVSYATHSQVLQNHPAFQWRTVVDPDENARELATSRWNIPRVASSVDALDGRELVDVLVMAIPPGQRIAVLSQFPNLKAVVVEKPLGESMEESRAFVDLCAERNIQTQVNLTRRADRSMIDLRDGGLDERVGHIQCVFGTYGNGIRNNGTHMVDLSRMLFGEIDSVRALPDYPAFQEGPLRNDLNFGFQLFTRSGFPITFNPVRFSNFRECHLDIWGSTGRVEILQEGLVIRTYSLAECRSLQGAVELKCESEQRKRTGYGRALFDMYDDLASSIPNGSVVSPASSALKTEGVIECLVESFTDAGRTVRL